MDQPVTAAVRMPSVNLFTANADREQVEFLAQYLQDMGTEFPGVVGPAKASQIFAGI